MSADSEREFDRQLSEHLAATLKPQLGRAGRAFEEIIRHERMDRQRQHNHRRWFAVASGASLIAASVALAMVLWRPQAPARREVVNSSPVPSPAMPSDQPREVEQLVAWQTFDEGVENIRLQQAPDKPLPVHRLRQEAIQQVEWFDPADKSTIRLLVPRQEELLIAQETY